jgi:hypothetical protein
LLHIAIDNKTPSSTEEAQRRQTQAFIAGETYFFIFPHSSIRDFILLPLRASLVATYRDCATFRNAVSCKTGDKYPQEQNTCVRREVVKRQAVDLLFINSISNCRRRMIEKSKVANTHGHN